jgi:hemoglobin
MNIGGSCPVRVPLSGGAGESILNVIGRKGAEQGSAQRNFDGERVDPESIGAQQRSFEQPPTRRALLDESERSADTINGVEEHEIYSAIGGDGFERLVAAFYRQVPGDDILGPIYPAHDLRGAEQRLRDFLIFRFGGPAVYIEQRGHPRLRMRHAPFPIGQVARDRWVQLMNRAMDEAVLPDDVRQVLEAFFESTATFLMNQPEG